MAKNELRRGDRRIKLGGKRLRKDQEVIGYK